MSVCVGAETSRDPGSILVKVAPLHNFIFQCQFIFKLIVRLGFGFAAIVEVARCGGGIKGRCGGCGTNGHKASKAVVSGLPLTMSLLYAVFNSDVKVQTYSVWFYTFKCHQQNHQAAEIHLRLFLDI